MKLIKHTYDFAPFRCDGDAAMHGQRIRSVDHDLAIATETIAAVDAPFVAGYSPRAPPPPVMRMIL